MPDKANQAKTEKDHEEQGEYDAKFQGDPADSHKGEQAHAHKKSQDVMPGNEIGRRRRILRIEIYESLADAVGRQKSITHLAQYFDMGGH